MADQQYLAGLDIGSTGCKMTLYDTEGNWQGRIYRDCPITRTVGNHEVDAQGITQTVMAVIQEAAEKYPGIIGIGITSFGESFVLLDANDKPLLPIMLYTDPRGSEECCQLIERLGADTIQQITGVSPAPLYSLPKLMWVKRHRPDIWEKTKRICLMEDYIVYLLTGTAQIDYSLATRTMAFDIQQLCWSRPLLDACGIDESLLSVPVLTGTSAGKVKAEMARLLGLDEHTIVVSVSHDQVAAAIGSGVFDESCAVDGAGTVECVTPVFDKYDGATMAANSYNIVPFIIPGKYVTYAFTFTGGALVNWCIERLSGDALQQARDQNEDVFNVLEQGCKDEPTGLLVLPHFAGAATPHMDHGSKGAIVGLSMEHSIYDLYRAMMEGVCYEMCLNQERLAEAGVRVAALRATGGGARSRMWLQMKADILNIPITSLDIADAGTTGSAMLTGIACGIFPSLAEAASIMVREKETFFPRPMMHEKYSEIYQRYRRLYQTVRPLV